jgi:hypothetical protein
MGSASNGDQYPTGFRRLLAFVEHPLSLTVFGIIGGIVGILFAIPVMLVCDGCILLALHRSRAIGDKSIRQQAIWYAATFVIIGGLCLWIGQLLKNSAREAVMDIAAATSDRLTKLNQHTALRITGWERLPVPLASTDTINVHLHIANESRPIKTVTNAYWGWINKRPEQASYVSRRDFEEGLWNGHVANNHAPMYESVTIPEDASGQFWLPLQLNNGDGTIKQITNTEIAALRSCDAVYFMGRIQDTTGKTLLEFCAYTGKNDATIMYCARHNGAPNVQ